MDLALETSTVLRHPPCGGWLLRFDAEGYGYLCSSATAETRWVTEDLVDHLFQGGRSGQEFCGTAGGDVFWLRTRQQQYSHCWPKFPAPGVAAGFLHAKAYILGLPLDNAKVFWQLYDVAALLSLPPDVKTSAWVHNRWRHWQHLLDVHSFPRSCLQRAKKKGRPA